MQEYQYQNQNKQQFSYLNDIYLDPQSLLEFDQEENQEIVSQTNYLEDNCLHDFDIFSPFKINQSPYNLQNENNKKIKNKKNDKLSKNENYPHLNSNLKSSKEIPTTNSKKTSKKKSKQHIQNQQKKQKILENKTQYSLNSNQSFEDDYIDNLKKEESIPYSSVTLPNKQLKKTHTNQNKEADQENNQKQLQKIEELVQPNFQNQNQQWQYYQAQKCSQQFIDSQNQLPKIQNKISSSDMDSPIKTIYTLQKQTSLDLKLKNEQKNKLKKFPTYKNHTTRSNSTNIQNNINSQNKNSTKEFLSDLQSQQSNQELIKFLQITHLPMQFQQIICNSINYNLSTIQNKNQSHSQNQISFYNNNSNMKSENFGKNQNQNKIQLQNNSPTNSYKNTTFNDININMEQCKYNFKNKPSPVQPHLIKSNKLKQILQKQQLFSTQKSNFQNESNLIQHQNLKTIDLSPYGNNNNNSQLKLQSSQNLNNQQQQQQQQQSLFQKQFSNNNFQISNLQKSVKQQSPLENNNNNGSKKKLTDIFQNKNLPQFQQQDFNYNFSDDIFILNFDFMKKTVRYFPNNNYDKVIEKYNKVHSLSQALIKSKKIYNVNLKSRHYSNRTPQLKSSSRFQLF